MLLYWVSCLIPQQIKYGSRYWPDWYVLAAASIITLYVGLSVHIIQSL